MTLIECFSRIPVENIAACLLLQPEKLIFLGNEDQMRQPVQRYVEFFAQRGLSTKVVLCHVSMDDMEAITHALDRIIRSESECVIDITGGETPVIMAVGAVLAGLGRKQQVKVQKFDLRTGILQDYDGDKQVAAGPLPSLRVQELIMLHGGSVHPRTAQPPLSYTPDQIKPLWDMVCKDPRVWNKKITILNELESRSESRTDIELSLDEIAGGIANFAEKETMVRELLDKLHQSGVIDDRSSFHTLRYTYTDPVLHECVKKAGNMLEIKTLLEARSLLHDGERYFHDCQMSVTIDWDGVVHAPAAHTPDTRNEIDVILTRGMIPIFISCKNGSIGEEELYKLNTVAARFGSRYARKMLIATDLEQKSPMANQAFIQRAKDMGIYLVPNAALLSGDDWARVLKEAMEGP